MVFLGVAFLLHIVGDTIFAIQGFGAAYTLGSAVDVTWLVSYACFGAALLHPAMAGDRYRHAGTVRALTPIERVEVARAASAAQGLRFSIVLTWAGAMLSSIAVASLLLGLVWSAPDVVLLGGVFGLTGPLMFAARFVRR
jgi:hypothetical protein